VDLNNMPYMDSLPEGMDPALYSSDWLDNAENGLTNLGEYPELAASDADLGMFLGDLNSIAINLRSEAEALNHNQFGHQVQKWVKNRHNYEA
jgi:hypothetical protein